MLILILIPGGYLFCIFIITVLQRVHQHFLIEWVPPVYHCQPENVLNEKFVRKSDHLGEWPGHRFEISTELTFSWFPIASISPHWFICFLWHFHFTDMSVALHLSHHTRFGYPAPLYPPRDVAEIKNQSVLFYFLFQKKLSVDWVKYQVSIAKLANVVPELAASDRFSRRQSGFVVSLYQ